MKTILSYFCYSIKYLNPFYFNTVACKIDVISLTINRIMNKGVGGILHVMLFICRCYHLYLLFDLIRVY